MRLLLIAAVFLAGCSKEQPKPVEQPKAKLVEIPSATERLAEVQLAERKAATDGLAETKKADLSLGRTQLDQVIKYLDNDTPHAADLHLLLSLRKNKEGVMSQPDFEAVYGRVLAWNQTETFGAGRIIKLKTAAGR